MDTPKSYYQPGPGRSARVQDLFATVAPRYDLINDLQSFGCHRRWKRLLVKLAAPEPGQIALDVCCGTGDITLALAGQGLRAVGVDFSDAMLTICRIKTSALAKTASPQRETGASTELPCFVRGNALALPFPANRFDIVTVGYGLRNLSDWRAGLEEMTRVAKPGGRVIILDFGKPQNPLWRAVYFGYLRIAVPLLGRLICHDARAYKYILESLLQYPAQQGVTGWLKQSEFVEVQNHDLLGGAMSITLGRKPL